MADRATRIRRRRRRLAWATCASVAIHAAPLLALVAWPERPAEPEPVLHIVALERVVFEEMRVDEEAPIRSDADVWVEEERSARHTGRTERTGAPEPVRAPAPEVRPSPSEPAQVALASETAAHDAPDASAVSQRDVPAATDSPAQHPTEVAPVEVTAAEPLVEPAVPVEVATAEPRVAPAAPVEATAAPTNGHLEVAARAAEPAPRPALGPAQAIPMYRTVAYEPVPPDTAPAETSPRRAARAVRVNQREARTDARDPAQAAARMEARDTAQTATRTDARDPALAHNDPSPPTEAHPHTGAIAELGDPHATVGERVDHLPTDDLAKVRARREDLEAYLGEIRRRVEPHWRPRLVLRDAVAGRDEALDRILDGRTEVLSRLSVRLDADGRITAVWVRDSSGLDALDAHAVTAFRQAAPFPPPPRHLLEDGEIAFDWGARAHR